MVSRPSFAHSSAQTIAIFSGIGFGARIVEGEPRPADDVAEIRWVSAEELDSLDFAWDHDRELVQAALTRGSV